MLYLIRDTLTEISETRKNEEDGQYVAVISSSEWEKSRDTFDMGIDFAPGEMDNSSTKAEVNYDSLTGSFSIPNRQNPSETSEFYFALDEKGIVFVDDTGVALSIVRIIQRTKKWKFPSLERFIYDFLEQIVRNDRMVLEQYDKKLDELEDSIVTEKEEVTADIVNDVRNDMREFRYHYEQLIDFSQELEENENNFFKNDNLRFFRLYSQRVERLKDASNAVSEHAMQIRDLYKSHLDIKQNRIMTVLTVVTSIFMPLTLIAGWYGMNFSNMPELDSRWGYPTVIILSVLIVSLSLFFFKKKKWL